MVGGGYGWPGDGAARQSNPGWEDDMAKSSGDPAVVCWHCGTLVPVRRVLTLDGERVVWCPGCGRGNNLDRAGLSHDVRERVHPTGEGEH